MLLTVKDRLIQVCDAPSLRDIVMEKLCQLLRGFSCDVVSPGTERDHQLSLFIKRHIACIMALTPNAPTLVSSTPYFF